MRWTPAQVREHQARVHGARRRDRRDGTGALAKPQRGAGPEHAREDRRAEAATRYRLHVLHFRHALVDVGNLDVKPEVDGIVDSGLIVDDGPAYIAEESHEQIQIGKDEDERRVFVFTRTEGRG